MSNNYFQFKQFKVLQQNSSMKVCTDSCLFGGWFADKIEQQQPQPKSILDIGAGTGLLSLMMAQKTNAKIDAVEIDENSFLQARENFASSPWSSRLQTFHADVKKWYPQIKYDLVISNPPFFENDLKAIQQSKNIAKHHDALTLKDLLTFVKNNLTQDGDFAILLPFHRSDYFKKLAFENSFYLQEEVLVKQTFAHPWFRMMLYFTKKPGNQSSKEIIIKNSAGNYTEEFYSLLKDYYLPHNF